MKSIRVMMVEDHPEYREGIALALACVASRQWPGTGGADRDSAVCDDWGGEGGFPECLHLVPKGVAVASVQTRSPR